MRAVRRTERLFRIVGPLTLLAWLVWPACSSSEVTGDNKGAAAAAGAGGGGTTGTGTGTAHVSGSDFQLSMDARANDNLDAYSGPTEDANCGLVDFVLDRTPAPVILAQDRSYSMSQNVRSPGTGTKWDNVTAAVREVVRQTNASVSWGLKFFPNDKACQVSVGPEIPPSLMNADPIIAALDAIKAVRTPGNLTDGTPTHKVLDDLGKYLGGMGAVNKYIVLATDGEPSCAGDSPGSSNYEQARAAARAVAAAGIKIAAVGISFGAGLVFPGTVEENSGLGFLNYVAELGGMPANNPGNPYLKYYPVEDTAELVKAFNSIAEQVYSCTFKLPKPPPWKDDVAVKLDGVKVPRDATDGWEYDDDAMTSLTLHGTYCDRIKDSHNSATKVDVKIIMGCPGQIIP